MGIAGGWFVLGIGWIVYREQDRERQRHQTSKMNSAELGIVGESDPFQDPEEGVVTFDSKGEVKAKTSLVSPSLVAGETLSKKTSSVKMSEGESSGKTEESTMIKTPGTHEEASDKIKGDGVAGEYEQLKLLVSNILLSCFQLAMGAMADLCSMTFFNLFSTCTAMAIFNPKIRWRYHLSIHFNYPPSYSLKGISRRVGTYGILAE